MFMNQYLHPLPKKSILDLIVGRREISEISPQNTALKMRISVVDLIYKDIKLLQLYSVQSTMKLQSNMYIILQSYTGG